MRKFLKYFVFFFIISVLFTYFALTAIDNYIYKLERVSYLEQNTANANIVGTKIKLENDIQSLQFAFNNKYYTYLKDSKIYINYTKNGENHTIIEEDEEICYYKLLEDKNRIIYITSSDYSSTRTKLDIKTYEIENKSKNEFKTFYINNFSKVKDMNMSPLTNMIYINVETKNSYKTSNSIYKVTLFNDISLVRSSMIIDKMIPLQHKDYIYYQDDEYNVYFSSGSYSLFKSEVEMIGIDQDDQMYFIDKEKNSTVYILGGTSRTIVDTIKLTDTDVVKTYTNNVGVYLIYPTYVINVASDTPFEKIGRVSEYADFEAIKGNTMYLRTKDNILVTTKIKVENKDLEKQDSQETTDKKFKQE